MDVPRVPRMFETLCREFEQARIYRGTEKAVRRCKSGVGRKETAVHGEAV